MNTNSTITWIDATKELPDDDMTVLVALDDGEVWTGFHAEEQWHYRDRRAHRVRRGNPLGHLPRSAMRVTTPAPPIRRVDTGNGLRAILGHREARREALLKQA